MAHTPNTTLTQQATQPDLATQQAQAAQTAISASVPNVTFNGSPVTSAIAPTWTTINPNWTTTNLGHVSGTSYTFPTTSDVIKRLETIEKQLLILNRRLDLEEKYPALKDAYEQYMFILKLVDGEPEDKDKK